jgi:AcrR family transcriptional regulator
MDLRERILDATVTLIEADGLAALSMREVARRAGVSHQAPYHHFTDRQAILAAIAEEGFKRLNAGLASAAGSPVGTPPPISRKPAARTSSSPRRTRHTSA